MRVALPDQQVDKGIWAVDLPALGAPCMGAAAAVISQSPTLFSDY